MSRYIDEEIQKIGGKSSKQVENLKVLCAKLTEQFKKHLINHESMKKDLYKRFEIIESHLPVYRSELYKLMEQTEARTLGKVKEVKDALSSTILTNFTALDDREVFVNIINKNVEESRAQHDAMVEDIERVIDEVYNVRVSTEQSEKKLLEDAFRLQKSVNDNEAHINTSIIAEKAARKTAD